MRKFWSLRMWMWMTKKCKESVDVNLTSSQVRLVRFENNSTLREKNLIRMWMTKTWHRAMLDLWGLKTTSPGELSVCSLCRSNPTLLEFWCWAQLCCLFVLWVYAICIGHVVMIWRHCWVKISKTGCLNLRTIHSKELLSKLTKWRWASYPRQRY